MAAPSQMDIFPYKGYANFRSLVFLDGYYICCGSYDVKIFSSDLKLSQF